MTATAAAGPTCGASCGITRERERQRIAARALVTKAFPTGSETEPQWTPDEAPFSSDEISKFVLALEGALPCRACVVEGVEATWVHLVATMSPRTWLAVREHGTAPPTTQTENGLRIGLSSLGRYATLQEIRWQGERADTGYWIEEIRCAGIEDRRLQSFVKATQGILRRDRVTALDAVFLSESLAPGDTTDDARCLWNALFDADPMRATVGTFIPAMELQGEASAVASPR